MRRLVTLAAVLVLASSGLVVAGIDGSKHDLAAKDTNKSRICVFCHTPHNGNTGQDAPLWNHTLTTVSSYSTYSSTTLNAGTQAPQSGNSKLCLSCHDGTVALGDLLNDPVQAITDTTGLITGDALLGTTLGNDHPVGFTYDGSLSTEDGGLNNPSGLSKAVLFSDKVECASCHDVHDNTQVPFLIADNTGSALCLDCHNK